MLTCKEAGGWARPAPGLGYDVLGLSGAAQPAPSSLCVGRLGLQAMPSVWLQWRLVAWRLGRGQGLAYSDTPLAADSVILV